MHRTRSSRYRLLAVTAACLIAVVAPNFFIGRAVSAQSGNTRKTEPPPNQNQKPNQKLPDEIPGAQKPNGQEPSDPAANRPQGTPRRRPPTRPAQKDEEGETITIETNVVNLECVVYHKKTGQIFTDLKPQNFTVLEDNVKQDIVNFRAGESPITLVMILEFSRVIGGIIPEVVVPAAQFIEGFVKPEDYVSVVAFDIRPKVLNDFSNNPAELRSSINILARNFPAFSESNLFDALKFTLKGGKLDGEEYTGLEEVQGRTAVLLVSLGIDTFSKINFDQARKIVEGAGVPIYCLGIGNLAYKLTNNPAAELTFQQAFNTLRTFSNSSGGKYFPVTFPGELPTTLRSINNLLRNQYSLGYEPTNLRREGKRRKVQLLVDVNGDGQPDNKELEILYRQSYVEPGVRDKEKEKKDKEKEKKDKDGGKKS